MKQKKKKQGLSRLLEIAGQKKGLLLLAGLLSAGSAGCMLVPYWAVYEILGELLAHGGNIPEADGAAMIRWGWTAFLGLAGGLVLLYAALMASHVAAFRILYGLRVRLSEHIGRLPLGYLTHTSTGAIKKTMEQNIEKVETFIAHTIPDLVNVTATVVVMFLIFFTLDGLGLPGRHRGEPFPAILQLHGTEGARIYPHLLRRAGADECFGRAICTWNARGEDIRTKRTVVPTVQCRD